MRGAREHFESRNLASFTEFSVSKIEFKKLNLAFEAESFEKIYSQADFKRRRTSMVKVLKKFETQEDGSVLLMLSSCDHKEPKPVEGLDFKDASEDDRKAFLDREERHIDNYLIKGKTGPYSINCASKHDKYFEAHVRDTIDFCERHNIIIL